MAPGSRRDSVPVELQILIGCGILFILVLILVLLFWHLPGPAPGPWTNASVHVKILAINDFHGQLTPGQTLDKRPVGSAPVMASYLDSARAPGNADGTIIALPGDVVGASPPESGLLLDEPTLLFFNSFANPHCTSATVPTDASCNMVSYLNPVGTGENAKGSPRVLSGDISGASSTISGLTADRTALQFFNAYTNPFCTVASHAEDTSCNMVATLGNHEFDKGIPELMRKIGGGNGAAIITHLVDPYPGTKTTYVSANVVWKNNNTPILPPYTLRYVSGVRVAFIGADTMNTPRIQNAANIRDVVFLDEAESVNRYIPEIQGRGVHAIVVLLHEGGSQTPYDGPTRMNGTVTGRVAGIVSRLDADVDVVLSGHTHAFTNAWLANAGGEPVLLTQAYMYGKGYADVDLMIDRASGEIVTKSARIIPFYADQPPGTSPDPATAAFLAADEKMIAPVVGRLIGVAAAGITRDQDSAGESALGDLVADSQRTAMKTDVAFLSSGSVRADLSPGNITWGNLYSVQPFAGTVLSMNLSGEQILRALEQQWLDPLPPHNLVVSGLVYRYDPAKPAGSRVVDVKINDRSLDRHATYTAAMVDFLAGGGDGYTTFPEGTNITNGPVDVDALVEYTGSLPQPVNITADGRIQRIG